VKAFRNAALAVMVAVAIVAGGANPANADPGDLVGDVAAIHSGTVSLTGTQTTATSGCYDWVASIWATNYFGDKIWEYFQEINWCWDGSVITYLYRNRWGSAYIEFWQFQGHIQNSEGGGLYQFSYRAFTQGQFGHCPPANGCYEWRYPWLDMTVQGDGGYFGSAG
jgi:hypothetical protein